MSTPPQQPPVALPPLKQRRGLARMRYAVRYSLEGLKAGWGEPAFREEVWAAAVLLPASFWVGRHWTEVAVLCGCVVLVLVAELLNTAIEAAVDRAGTEWHVLAKRAKDTGSAAVFLSLLFAGAVWLAALVHRLA